MKIRILVTYCLFALAGWSAAGPLVATDVFKPVQPPAWVKGVTRAAFITPGDLDLAAEACVQVVHFNMVWPYYPLRKDGGGLPAAEKEQLRSFVEACHARGIKAILGLPPFPSVDLVKAHPDWRVHPDDQGTVLQLEPKEDNLGTRLGCNLGPWGDYLIEVLVEIAEDCKVDGYSFDGNYHPPICYCPACKSAWERESKGVLPTAVDLNALKYREYLDWRGRKLEDHYRAMQKRLKGMNPDLVVATWTVNAGRYGHFMTSPRAMPARMNLLFDLPMQEWWLDETNFGSSVAPSVGAAYLRAVTGDRYCACEPYLMSRGNPYGTDSFPRHERQLRSLLALTYGCGSAQSFGWSGHRESTKDVFAEIKQREPWITKTSSQPWAALLVSEQTRQFYAYADIAERFLPHVFGAFRACMEEHLAVTLINDWDLTAESLARYKVLILPNAAALSAQQLAAVRTFVREGGGLLATGETSLCDELGRPREDFGLTDLFGVSYRGRPEESKERPVLDANFAVTVDDKYWQQRVGVCQFQWKDHPIFDDEHLRELVPHQQARFRGPLVRVTEPSEAAAVVARFLLDGPNVTSMPAMIVQNVGKGRVVYLAAALDAALWSYAYPYQREVFARAIGFAAGSKQPVEVQAPLCVQATYFEQHRGDEKRTIVHLFNGISTAAGHGLPASEVPLREETLPIAGITLRFQPVAAASPAVLVEPGGISAKVNREGDWVTIEVPPLAMHQMVVIDPAPAGR